MGATRKQKMSRLLRDELSRIILEEMNDPRRGFISITDVELSPDMRTAHIYISVFGSPEEQATSMRALIGASSFLRGELARQLNLRFTPGLIFHHDTSIERGSRIIQLMNSLEKEQKQNDANDTTPAS